MNQLMTVSFEEAIESIVKSPTGCRTCGLMGPHELE